MYARARGSPIEAPTVGFRDTTPPLIEAELRRRYSYYIYIKGVTDFINRIVQILRRDLGQVRISAQEAELMEPVEPWDCLSMLRPRNR